MQKSPSFPSQVPSSPGTPPRTQRCAEDQGAKGFPSLGNCKGLKASSSEIREQRPGDKALPVGNSRAESRPNPGIATAPVPVWVWELHPPVETTILL